MLKLGGAQQKKLEHSLKQTTNALYFTCVYLLIKINQAIKSSNMK